MPKATHLSRHGLVNPSAAMAADGEASRVETRSRTCIPRPAAGVTRSVCFPRTGRWAYAAVVAVLASAPALGADGEGNGDVQREPKGHRFLQETHTGVVTDQTVTFIGQRFFREFVARWSDKTRADSYSIAVFERPSARWGSLIWVEYANRKVFQAFVSPGKADLRVLGEQAADRVYDNVVAADIQRLLIKEPDIGPDEI